jgi:hypothetical protein
MQVWRAGPSKGAKDAGAVSTTKRILYLTLRNLADLEDQSAAAESSLLSLALYSDALGVDGTDPIAWLQFGKAAEQGGAWDVARLALEQGLRLHARHPLLLDALLRLLLQVPFPCHSCLLALNPNALPVRLLYLCSSHAT